MNFKTNTKTNRLTNNKNNMAEVVNKLCSKDVKLKTKLAVLHYLNEKDCMDEWGSNYLSSFVTFAICVHHNSTRFPLSLIDQHERGMPCTEVEFVTKTATTCFFKRNHERHNLHACCNSIASLRHAIMVNNI